MYDLVDATCAHELNVSVETYIEKIEKTTLKRAELIIGAIFSENPKLKNKAIRIFNLIK